MSPSTQSVGRRWGLRALVAIGAILALWALAWALVPVVLKSQAERIGSRELGRELRIGRVDFKPWSLQLTLHDVSVATRDGQRAQLQVKRLHVDADLQSVFRLAPVLDEITIDQPRLELTRLANGRYDVDDLIERFSRPAPQAPDAEPQKFALYNLSLNDGSLRFADQPVSRTHTLDKLQVSVPFLSNLKSQREVRVSPRLAFVLNGSRFDSAAEGTPFAQTRKTDASLQVRDLDLAPYLPYVPQALPVRPVSGVVQSELRVAFEQSPDNHVRIAGFIALERARIDLPAGEPLAQWERLRVNLADVRPLDRQVGLESVTLEQPQLWVRRAADGRLNWAALAGPGASARPADAGAPTTAAAPGPADAGWRLTLPVVTVSDLGIQWSDATVQPVSRLSMTQAQISVRDVAWPMSTPATVSASAVLARAPIALAAQATDRQATATFKVDGLPLELAAPYLAPYLEPRLAGRLSAQAEAFWAQGGAGAGAASTPASGTTSAPTSAPGSASASASPRAPVGRASPAELRVNLPRLVLADLALTRDGQRLASLRALEIGAVAADMERQQVKVGRVLLDQPQIRIQRDRAGRWMFEDWLRTPPTGAGQPATAPQAQAAPAVAAAPAGARPAWQAALDELRVQGGSVGWQDLAAGGTVTLAFNQIQAQLKGWSSNRPAPMATSLQAQVSAGQTEAGRVDWRGSVGLEPVTAKGDITVERLPVHALEPYFGDQLNLELLRADAGFRGQVDVALSPQGLRATVRGDTVVDELRANSLQPPEELLSWKSLSLRGLDVALAPGAAPRVQIAETVLSDFYARLIISPQGRFNLQDLVKSSASSGTGTGSVAGPATQTVATTAPAAAPAPAPARPSASAAPAAPAVAATPAAPAPDIRFGPVSLVNGRVNFSDRFIKPNYSANLTELTGRLSAFSSQATDGQVNLADLELRGRAEGTASLEVLGKVNPLARPLALDIKGKVRELELPPLSPYAIKYAGYGIDRGKLSVDVAYLVKPDGQLTASNNIVLNQLTFGDKVEGGGNLPVKLAVALLKDRNGVIDINLPVSGSLNDPQFSVGPIIFRLIFNLIAKAITSPFSLLAAALGGGGDEMNLVGFAPGLAALDDEGRKRLDGIAKALNDRPGLKLTAVGTAGLEQEREGFKREQLNERVRAEKRRELARSGRTVTAVVEVSPAEYPALLKEVYKRADMPKPRNMVGMLKDIPQAEMEALLLADIKVSDDAMRQLAVQRSVAVKDYLAGRGLPVERLFLGAPKVVPPEAKWTPRAELNLEAR